MQVRPTLWLQRLVSAFGNPVMGQKKADSPQLSFEIARSDQYQVVPNLSEQSQKKSGIPFIDPSQLRVQEQLLGVGGFARVVRGDYLHADGREVPIALKFFSPSPENADDEDRIRYGNHWFQWEGRTLWMLQGKNPPSTILKYFGTSHLGGEDVHVMEHLSGMSFADLLGEKGNAKYLRDSKGFNKLTPLEIILVARQLLEALCYLHEFKSPEGLACSVIHRDMTAENVFFTDDGHIRLIDFGVSYCDHPERGSGTEAIMPGRNGYVELTDEGFEGKNTPKNDLHQLGVLLATLVYPKLIHEIENDDMGFSTPAGLNDFIYGRFIESVTSKIDRFPDAEFFESSDHYQDLISSLINFVKPLIVCGVNHDYSARELLEFVERVIAACGLQDYSLKSIVDRLMIPRRMKVPPRTIIYVRESSPSLNDLIDVSVNLGINEQKPSNELQLPIYPSWTRTLFVFVLAPAIGFIPGLFTLAYYFLLNPEEKSADQSYDLAADVFVGVEDEKNIATMTASQNNLEDQPLIYLFELSSQESVLDDRDKKITEPEIQSAAEIPIVPKRKIRTSVEVQLPLRRLVLGRSEYTLQGHKVFLSGDLVLNVGSKKYQAHVDQGQIKVFSFRANDGDYEFFVNGRRHTLSVKENQVYLKD